MVEIGAIEVLDREVQEHKIFHHYINPERSIPQEVVRIHGIDDHKVKNAPTFADIAQDFLQFVEGAIIVIHNAAFDLGFIRSELAHLELPTLDHAPVIDTLELARKQYPNQRNNLDALCDRFHIDRGHRSLHGALLDAKLLAEVYLELTGGRQYSLGSTTPTRPAEQFSKLPEVIKQRVERIETQPIMRRSSPPLSSYDLDAHHKFMERIHKESGGNTIWKINAAPATSSQP